MSDRNMTEKKNRIGEVGVSNRWAWPLDRDHDGFPRPHLEEHETHG